MTTSLERLAARVRAVEKLARRQATTPQLAHASVEDGSLDVNVSTPDEEGNVTPTTTMQIGLQYDGTSMPAVLTGPVPPQPVAPTVEEVIGGLKVIVPGTFIDALVVPMDFARWEIHVSEDPNFYPDLASTLYATIESPRGGEHTLALPYRKHYVRIVARSVPGKGSSPSDRAEGTPRYVQQLDLDPDIELGGDTGPTEAPASSPAATVAPLGIGGVMAAWPSIQGAEAYEVYVSTEPITIFDETTFLGEGTANSLAIGQLPGGVNIPPGSEVYVRVWAKNSIGRAPEAGAEGSATTRQATTGDIASDFVYAGLVEATQITSGNLDAAIALLGSLTVGEADGRRITLNSSGFSVVDANGASLVAFPTVTGGINTFRGDIVAQGFTALGRASFRGNDNEISRNSSFTMASGTTAPANAPQVDAYDEFYSAAPEAFRAGERRFIFQDGDTLYTIRNDSTNLGVLDWKMVGWDITTGETGPVTEFALPANMRGISGGFISSFAKIGSTFYMLHLTQSANPTTYTWQIWRFSSTAYIGAWNWIGPATIPRTNYNLMQWAFRPYLHSDGTSLYVATGEPTAAPTPVDTYYFSGNAKIRVEKLNSTGGVAQSWVTPTAVPYHTLTGSATHPEILGLKAGTFDFAGPRFLVWSRLCDNPTPRYAAPKVFDQATMLEDASYPVTGFTSMWGPAGTIMKESMWRASESRWYIVNNAWGYPASGKLSLYKAAKLPPRKIWLAYSWYDSDPAGTGTHETTLSPKTPMQVPRYQGFGVALQVQPADAGDPDSPDSARWYYYEGEDEPADEDMRLLPQGVSGVFFGNSYLADQAWLEPTPTTTPPPTANSFPDGFAGELRSQIGGFVARGDGTGAWPFLEDKIQGHLQPLWEGADDTLAADISSLSAAGTAIENRLDLAEPKITDHENRLDLAEPKITDHENRLDIIETDPTWHYIGDPGEPQWQNGFSGNSASLPRFTKDIAGNIHLAGRVDIPGTVGNGYLMFTLPVGYRPRGQTVTLQTTASSGTITRLSVGADGECRMYTGIGAMPTYTAIEVIFRP